MKLWLAATGLALGLMTAQTAAAREFDVLAVSPESLIAMTLPTRSPGSATVAVTVSLIFAKDQALFGAQLAYLSTDWEFDCGKRLYRVTGASGFDKAGEVAAHPPNDHPDWTAVPDGGIEAELTYALCDGARDDVSSVASEKTVQDLLATYRENAWRYDPANFDPSTVKLN